MDRPVEKYTVQSFVELLSRHSTLGLYIGGKNPTHTLVDGWFNLESLVAELNVETSAKADAMPTDEHSF